MYKITRKEVLNDFVLLMDIEAPYVSAKCEAGQFVIIRVDDEGERIPLTIADFDREKNTVTIIFQKVGYSTNKMAELNEGDYLEDFVGPLGKPSPVKEWKKVIGIAGGVGAAPIYPQLKKLAQAGIDVDVIIGGRSKEFIILADKFREFCKNVYIVTDDGSLGDKGFVTNKLQELIDSKKEYDHAIAIGPLVMMRAVVNMTKPLNLSTEVSLNPIMIDGTGMCGGCRVTVGNETKFACVDGPDFDGFNVDFDEAIMRQGFFKKEEEHACRIR